MTVGEFLFLREEGKKERELLLMELLNMGRGELYRKKLSLLPENDERLYEMDLSLSREMPVEYVLGKTTFFGRSFFVGEGVLIPRQETELLVELLLSESGSSHKNILDLCTGSGVIGLTIASERPEVFVSLSDIDEKALDYAIRNREHLKVKNCEIVSGNLFEPFSGRKFDVIVSNPPYVPTGELNFLEPSVKFEPETALDGGCDGLKFYREISKKLPLYLADGGMFLAEIGYNQGEELKKIFGKGEIQKDYQGNDRFFIFRN